MVHEAEGRFDLFFVERFRLLDDEQFAAMQFREETSTVVHGSRIVAEIPVDDFALDLFAGSNG